MDNLTHDQRRKCMQLNKSSDTSPEKRLRSILWRLGLRFRKNSKVLGKPDLVFTRHRVVVFVDGCFWHGCKQHSRLPKSNRDYWVQKIRRNKKRDKRVTSQLRDQGWKVIRFWEHSTTSDMELAEL
jgi:DNA mismatch endonuclease, patch repair protein